MQDEDDEWGAFGAAADHTLALDPADHPRDVPTAQGEGTGGVKGGDDSVVDRVEDDDDFADFEAAPATPTQEDADDEFGDFAEQPPQPAAGTQPEPVRAEEGDEDGFGDFADFEEAPAPPPLPRRRRRFPSRSDRRGIWPRSGGTISPQGARRRSGSRFLAARDGTSVHKGRMCTVQMKRRRWMRGRRCATP